jgi:hypothetical protein
MLRQMFGAMPCATSILLRSIQSQGIVHAAGGINLTEEQRQEYLELKVVADEETVLDRDAIEQERAAVADMEASVGALQTRLEEMRTQEEKLQSEIAEVRDLFPKLPSFCAMCINTKDRAIGGFLFGLTHSYRP